MTKKILSILVMILVMGEVAMMQAQEKQRPERNKPSKEQMQERRVNRVVRELALNDAQCAKFTPLYNSYIDETRQIMEKYPKGNGVRKGGQGENKAMTDKEAETFIKNDFSRQRAMTDVKEKYYKKFKEFLTPQQIMKIYSLGGKNFVKNGKKHRKAMKCADCGGKRPYRQ